MANFSRTKQTLPAAASQAEDDDLLIMLVEALEKIDADSPLAAENAVSITDNNGDRILL